MRDKVTTDMKTLMSTHFIIAMIFVVVGFFAGKRAFISECENDGVMVFNNNLIVQCRTTDINLILNKNYWERKE